MLDPVLVETTYKEFMGDLGKWAHDGILHIDLNSLHELGILHSIQEDQGDPDDLSQYFHIVESVEKVTLFNDQFVVWIVPKNEEALPHTYVLIAISQANKPHLEVVFSTSGIYNTPRFVLKVLQHFLLDMLETQATLTSMEKTDS